MTTENQAPEGAELTDVQIADAATGIKPYPLELVQVPAEQILAFARAVIAADRAARPSPAEGHAEALAAALDQLIRYCERRGFNTETVSSAFLADAKDQLASYRVRDRAALSGTQAKVTVAAYKASTEQEMVASGLSLAESILAAQAPAPVPEPTAFVHWPLNGPPRLVWHSNKAMHAAIERGNKAQNGYVPDLLLYGAPVQAPAVTPDDARDAARYRFLRDEADADVYLESTSRDMDARVDAAMGASHVPVHPMGDANG